MTMEGFKRKLTTMFSADVAGYSRLMAEDEAETVKTLRAYRKIMTELIKQHRGRVVDSPGDNVLAEFTSVVDAVQCAVTVQKELQARNGELPEDRRMEFRIGINLGDVIEEEERIYGDGVNIAARLEGLAYPGGICISKTAFDQIETKLPLGYEYLGEKTVKNIAKPMGAYRILMEPRVTVADKEKMALPLPEEPSIAVLPFANISGDPEQEYFNDGLTEEIITALSKVHNMFVIARNSTFSYKDKPVKVQQVAEELGVRYVMEGSVRKAGDRVRITAQLIDALTGHHLWAERYDRDLEDIFALQDEITKNILTALEVKLTRGEDAHLWAGSTNNLEAYLKYLQGMEYTQRFDIESNLLGRQKGEEAIALDPEFPMAYVLMGWTHLMDILFGSSKSPGKSLERAEEVAQKAIALNPSQAATHSLLGYVHMMKRHFEEAVAECERAVVLSPNGADNHAFLGMILNYAGRPDEAISALEKALRLNPFPPSYYLHNLGRAYRMTGRYEEAIAEFKKALQGAPGSMFATVELITTNSILGREEEAREAAAEFRRINPKFSLESFAKSLPFKNQTEIERLVAALRKVGLK
jgi:adenylate cyclase